MEHTISAYEAELNELSAGVERLGALCEAQLDQALTAIFRADVDLARAVVAKDPELDALAVEIERKAIRLIALRHPMADDLRRAVSAMKIALNLERVGDLAKSTAKRGLKIFSAKAQAPAEMAAPVERLGRLVAERLHAVLAAYAADDAQAAMQVWMQDAEVDEHYEQLFSALLARMAKEPNDIAACTHLIFIAKNLERLGDHATNIAELVHYQITGQDLPDERPKLDA